MDLRRFCELEEALMDVVIPPEIYEAMMDALYIDLGGGG